MIAMPQNPLPDLIGRLLREPLVWIVLVSWIAGGIGKILQAKKKRDAALGRSRGLGDRFDDAREVTRPASGRRSPEEVAAEMRRLLGMDRPPVAQPQPQPQPRPQLARPQAPPPVVQRREASEGDRGTQPMRPSQLGKVSTHVDPHVGEGVQRRAAPMSGGVAAHELGTLGGRSHVAGRRGAQSARGLVDLSDMSRAIVLREILDEPRALRPWGGY
jgi:hypothetical protein